MNWNEYKDFVKETDPLGKEMLEEAEAEASIILRLGDGVVGKHGFRHFPLGGEAVCILADFISACFWLSQ